MVYRSVKRRDEGIPFVATIGIYVFTYLGLIVSKWPVIVPPNYTLWDAASAPESQLFLLIGVLFVIPIILAYTAWTYWVFRGKVRVGEGYH
jgi:cytochrome d ubiquinol oxidase subunit II